MNTLIDISVYEYRIPHVAGLEYYFCVRILYAQYAELRLTQILGSSHAPILIAFSVEAFLLPKQGPIYRQHDCALVSVDGELPKQLCRRRWPVVEFFRCAKKTKAHAKLSI